MSHTVIVIALLCKETLWPRQVLEKKTFNWGQAHSFRGTVHYHRDRECGSKGRAETVAGSYILNHA